MGNKNIFGNFFIFHGISSQKIQMKELFFSPQNSHQILSTASSFPRKKSFLFEQKTGKLSFCNNLKTITDMTLKLST